MRLSLMVTRLVLRLKEVGARNGEVEAPRAYFRHTRGAFH